MPTTTTNNPSLVVPSPFPILERVKLLNDTARLFSKVEVAVSAQAAFDEQHTSDALFVVMGKSNANADLSSQATIGFEVEFSLISYFSASLNGAGAQAQTHIDAVRGTLINWLHGWSPPNASEQMRYSSSALLAKENRDHWFSDTFKYTIYSTLPSASTDDLEEFLKVHSTSLIKGSTVGKLTEIADLEVRNGN